MTQVDPNTSVRVFHPDGSGSARPALLWIHGGGLVLGTAELDDRWCRRVADELDIVVASVDYRLAPENPYPAALDDCHAALGWLAQQSQVEPSRIAVGGASAGGGLAAALAMRAAREDGSPKPVFQLLVYPMLDDRTGDRGDADPRGLRVWNRRSNAFGWRSYLGASPSPLDLQLAVPARSKDLSALPPAWIGVGTNDLFHREDVAFARRLRESGVECTLHEVWGAYHGFDLLQPRAPVTRSFQHMQIEALRHVLSHRLADHRPHGSARKAKPRTPGQWDAWERPGQP